MILIPILEQLKSNHRGGRISDRHYVGLYILLHHFRRYQSGHYARQKNPGRVQFSRPRTRPRTRCGWRTSGNENSLFWERKLEEVFLAEDFQDIAGWECRSGPDRIPVKSNAPCLCFQDLRLRFIPSTAQDTWQKWSRGLYPLDFIHHLPTSPEMLLTQSRGRRWLTLRDHHDEHLAPIERFSDAFEFLLHDLEHAHHYFSDPEQYFSQIAFYERIGSCLAHAQLWTQLNQTDPKFLKDLNYALSDMNSHVWHLIQYVNAISIQALRRKEHSVTVSAAGEAQLQIQWEHFYCGVERGTNLAMAEYGNAKFVSHTLAQYGRQHLAKISYVQANQFECLLPNRPTLG